MRVSALDATGDWTFGKGRANYIADRKAIKQNVKTRLRSFTDDWFLDVDNGIPWLDLLGNLGTERRILRAVERTVLQTEGVLSVQNVAIVGRNTNRGVTIELSYTDVYSVTVTETLELTA